MNYIATTTALGLISAGTLYLIKREADQTRKAIKTQAEILIKQNLVDIFEDTVVPHCTLLTLANLSSVCTKFKNSCKKLIDLQKPIFEEFVLQIRPSVPSELINRSIHESVFHVKISHKNRLILILLKIENIQATFISITYYGKCITEGFSPTLKVTFSDSMDEQTSILVTLALKQLNKELYVKAGEDPRYWRSSRLEQSKIGNLI